MPNLLAFIVPRCTKHSQEIDNGNAFCDLVDNIKQEWSKCSAKKSSPDTSIKPLKGCQFYTFFAKLFFTCFSFFIFIFWLLYLTFFCAVSNQFKYRFHIELCAEFCISLLFCIRAYYEFLFDRESRFARK